MTTTNTRLRAVRRQLREARASLDHKARARGIANPERIPLDQLLRLLRAEQPRPKPLAVAIHEVLKDA